MHFANEGHDKVEEKVMAKKAMSPADFVIRCYVEQEPDGSWFAMCIDLNLCAQAGTIKEAKSNLDAIVHDYLVDAFTQYRGHPELLTRRTPLSFVLRYHVIALQCAVALWRERQFQQQKHDYHHERYRQTVPMIPAPC